MAKAVNEALDAMPRDEKRSRQCGSIAWSLWTTSVDYESSELRVGGERPGRVDR